MSDVNNMIYVNNISYVNYMCKIYDVLIWIISLRLTWIINYFKYKIFVLNFLF